MWSTTSPPALNNSEIVSLGSTSHAGGFTATVTRDLVPNLKYYVVAYAKSEKYLVYGEVLTFTSLGSKAPKILDFKPRIDSWNDTVTIMGNNFSNLLANTQVTFGSSIAKVISCSADTIKVSVPDNLLIGSYRIKVSILGNVASDSGFVLTVNPPTISSVSPDTIIVNDLLSIRGRNFNANFTSVTIGGVSALEATVTPNLITVRVPKGVPNGRVSVNVKVLNNQVTASQMPIKEPPTITSISPLAAAYDDRLTITGNYYPADTSLLKVFFDNTPAQISSITRNQIQLNVPYFNTQASPTIKVIVESSQATFQGFQLSPITILSVVPSQHLMPGDPITITGGNFASNFSIKLNGFVVPPGNITSVTDSQIKFSLPLTAAKINTLALSRFGKDVIAGQTLNLILSYKNGKIPFGTDLFSSSNFQIGGKDYFGFGSYNGEYGLLFSNSFFSYEAATDSLTPINISNIGLRFSPLAFSIGGIGYFGGGKSYTPYSDFYSFDPATNSISQINSFPLAQGGVGASVASFVINNKAYCLFESLPNNLVFEFDPADNLWTQKADFPGAPRGNYGYFGTNYHATPFTFVINGIGYMGGGVSSGGGNNISDLWSYDPSADAWTQLVLGATLSDNICLVNANGKTYLVSTDGGWQTNYTYNTYFYEFQPLSNTFTIAPFSTSNFQNEMNGSFAIGTSGFIYVGSQIWEFDPTM